MTHLSKDNLLKSSQQDLDFRIRSLWNWSWSTSFAGKAYCLQTVFITRLGTLLFNNVKRGERSTSKARSQGLSSRSIRKCKIALKSFDSACWGKGGGGGSRPRFCGGIAGWTPYLQGCWSMKLSGWKIAGENGLANALQNLSIPLFTDSVIHLIFAARVFLHQMRDLMWIVKCEGISSVYKVTCYPARALISNAAQHFVPPQSP